MILVVEGRKPTQNSVQETAKRPHVDQLRVGVGLGGVARLINVDHLRSSVTSSATRGFHRVVGSFHHQPLGKTIVGQLDCTDGGAADTRPELTFILLQLVVQRAQQLFELVVIPREKRDPGEQQVFGFDIAMDNVMAVQMVHRREKLGEHVTTQRFREIGILDDLVKDFAAVAVFEHEVGMGDGGDGVDQLKGVGVRGQFLHDFHLVADVFELFGQHVDLVDDFDGDGGVGFGVDGAVDGGKSAFADHQLEAVAVREAGVHVDGEAGR